MRDMTGIIYKYTSPSNKVYIGHFIKNNKAQKNEQEYDKNII